MRYRRYLLGIVLVCLVSTVCLAHKIKQKSFLRAQSTFTGRQGQDLTQRPTVEPTESPLLELIVNPEALSELGKAEVAWNSIPNATVDDYITLSCGPRANLTDFIDRTNVTMNPAQGPRPNGSVQIGPLVDMRCNYTFDYIRVTVDTNGVAKHERVATSREVGMKEPYGFPRQGRVSLGDDPSTSLWISFTSAFGPSTHQPVVRYSFDKDAKDGYIYSRVSNSSTYNVNDLCQAPATLIAQVWYRDPGYHHHVLLNGLKPGLPIYYSFGLEDKAHPESPGLWSDVFKTATLAPAGANTTVSFIAYGDMGDDPEPSSYSTMLRAEEEVTRNGYQFVLHFGDISYARGNAYDWDLFGGMLQGLATKVPYLVSLGNHEYCYDAVETDPTRKYDITGAPVPGFRPDWGNYARDSAGECAVPMHHRWRAPNTVPGSNHIYWYAFQTGPVYIIQISTEHDFTEGSVQYQWLKATLQSIDRKRTPFVILTAHRMMYTTQLCEDNDYRVSLHIRQHLEPLLQGRVNLVLVGHQHSYERTCPVFGGECTDDWSKDKVPGLRSRLASRLSHLPHQADHFDRLPDLVKAGRINLEAIFEPQDILSHPNQKDFFEYESRRRGMANSLGSADGRDHATEAQLQAQYPSSNPHYTQSPSNTPTILTKTEAKKMHLMQGPATSMKARYVNREINRILDPLDYGPAPPEDMPEVIRQQLFENWPSFYGRKHTLPGLELLQQTMRLGEDTVNIRDTMVSSKGDPTKLVNSLLEPKDVGFGGTVHITVGTAGAGLEKCGFSPKYGPFSRVQTNSWGLLKVRASPTQMVVEFVRTVQGDTYDRLVFLAPEIHN